MKFPLGIFYPIIHHYHQANMRFHSLLLAAQDMRGWMPMGTGHIGSGKEVLISIQLDLKVITPIIFPTSRTTVHRPRWRIALSALHFALCTVH